MNMDRLLESLKKHEGYRNKVYLDTLGKRTIGYGHLCVEDFWEDDKEYEQEYLEGILVRDLQNAIEGAEELLGEHTVYDECKEILIEMVFQLGKTGVSKFKNMWKALKDPRVPDYKTAATEMLDSRWAKQTPNRANDMADTMRSLG